MPKYLKLNYNDKTPILINIEFIMTIFPEHDSTSVTMASGHHYYVNESVEQIDAMLHELEKTND